MQKKGAISEWTYMKAVTQIRNDVALIKGEIKWGTRNGKIAKSTLPEEVRTRVSDAIEKFLEENSIPEDYWDEAVFSASTMYGGFNLTEAKESGEITRKQMLATFSKMKRQIADFKNYVLEEQGKEVFGD